MVPALHADQLTEVSDFRVQWPSSVSSYWLVVSVLDGWPCPSQVTLTTFTPGLHPAQACSSEGPGMLGSRGCRASPIESRSASVPACWQPCCQKDYGLRHLPCPDYISCVESACHNKAS